MAAPITRQMLARELAMLLVRPLVSNAPGSRHEAHLILEHYPHWPDAGFLGALLVRLRSPHPGADVPDAILETERRVTEELAADPLYQSVAGRHLEQLGQPLAMGALRGHHLRLEQEIDGHRTRVEAMTNREGCAIFPNVLLHLPCRIEHLPETLALVWNAHDGWQVFSSSPAGRDAPVRSLEPGVPRAPNHVVLFALGKAATIIGGVIVTALAAGPMPLGGAEPPAEPLEIAFESSVPQPVKLRAVISQDKGGWVVEIRGAAGLLGPRPSVELFSALTLPLRRMYLGDAVLRFPCPSEALTGEWGVEFRWFEDREERVRRVLLPPVRTER